MEKKAHQKIEKITVQTFPNSGHCFLRNAFSHPHHQGHGPGYRRYKSRSPKSTYDPDLDGLWYYLGTSLMFPLGGSWWLITGAHMEYGGVNNLSPFPFGVKTGARYYFKPLAPTVRPYLAATLNYHQNQYGCLYSAADNDRPPCKNHEVFARGSLGLNFKVTSSLFVYLEGSIFSASFWRYIVYPESIKSTFLGFNYSGVQNIFRNSIAGLTFRF